MLHGAQSALVEVARRARHRADPVPRSRRGDRAGRGTDEPGDPRPGAGIRGGPAQAHRAGRGHRRELLRRDHRAPPSRAADRGGPARLDARARRAPSAGRDRVGAPIMDELARLVAGRVPGARPRRPGVRGVLPRHHADRRAVGPAPRVAPGRARPPRRAPRRSISSGRSRGRSPGRRRGSTCPAGSASGTALERYRDDARRGRARRRRPPRSRLAVPARASSTTPR